MTPHDLQLAGVLAALGFGLTAGAALVWLIARDYERLQPMRSKPATLRVSRRAP